MSVSITSHFAGSNKLSPSFRQTAFAKSLLKLSSQSIGHVHSKFCNDDVMKIITVKLWSPICIFLITLKWFAASCTECNNHVKDSDINVMKVLFSNSHMASLCLLRMISDSYCIINRKGRTVLLFGICSYPSVVGWQCGLSFLCWNGSRGTTITPG